MASQKKIRKSQSNGANVITSQRVLPGFRKREKMETADGADVPRKSGLVKADSDPRSLRVSQRISKSNSIMTKLSVGDVVIVTKAFKSNCKNKYRVAVDSKGEILEINAKGIAKIAFETLDRNTWVKPKNFSNLKKFDLADQIEMAIRSSSAGIEPFK